MNIFRISDEEDTIKYIIITSLKESEVQKIADDIYQEYYKMRWISKDPKWENWIQFWLDIKELEKKWKQKDINFKILDIMNTKDVGSVHFYLWWT